MLPIFPKMLPIVLPFFQEHVTAVINNRFSGDIHYCVLKYKTNTFLSRPVYTMSSLACPSYIFYKVININLIPFRYFNWLCWWNFWYNEINSCKTSSLRWRLSAFYSNSSLRIHPPPLRLLLSDIVVLFVGIWHGDCNWRSLTCFFK